MTAGERQGLDVAAVRRWYAGAVAALRAHRETIDEENVYPVADGDTGTNLLATVESGCAAADAVESTNVGDVVRAFADGALLGAKGNSGLIMSQLLRGLAGAVGSRRTISAAQLRDALDSAARSAYASVGVPVEGTILTVIAAAAEAAHKTKGDVAAVAAAAAAGARAALARTTAQLPALKRAGVVDAGGRGLVLVLDALAVATGARPQREAPHPRRRRALRDATEAAQAGGSHEVIYLLEADELSARELRAQLVAMGDSVVVAGGEPLFKVHVHLDDPDAAVRAGEAHGRLRDVAVTVLRDEQRCAVDAAMVAVTGCPGIHGLLDDAGVDIVLDGAASLRELRSAIEKTGALDVVVLADRPSSALAARRAAAASKDARVYVVGMQSAVQLLAAVSVHDPERAPADDVPMMTTAAAATRVRAVRAAADPAGAARRASDRLLRAGGELVTVITGAGCPSKDVDSLVAYLAQTYPHVEVNRYDGGQRDSLMLIGVE